MKDFTCISKFIQSMGLSMTLALSGFTAIYFKIVVEQPDIRVKKWQGCANYIPMCYG